MTPEGFVEEGDSTARQQAAMMMMQANAQVRLRIIHTCHVKDLSSLEIRALLD
jgi:hypothetical protein